MVICTIRCITLIPMPTAKVWNGFARCRFRRFTEALWLFWQRPDERVIAGYLAGEGRLVDPQDWVSKQLL